MPLNIVLLRPQKMVSTKTPLLKHYYRHQGKPFLENWLRTSYVIISAAMGLEQFCALPCQLRAPNSPTGGSANLRARLSQARKRHININFLVRLLLGQTQVFSLLYTMEAQFVPGTNPVCPGDIAGTKGGRKSLCVKSLCAFFVPY